MISFLLPCICCTFNLAKNPHVHVQITCLQSIWCRTLPCTDSLELQSPWDGWLPLHSHTLSSGIYLSSVCISFHGYLNSEMDWAVKTHPWSFGVCVGCPGWIWVLQGRLWSVRLSQFVCWRGDRWVGPESMWVFGCLEHLIKSYKCPRWMQLGWAWAKWGNKNK